MSYRLTIAYDWDARPSWICCHSARGDAKAVSGGGPKRAAGSPVGLTWPVAAPDAGLGALDAADEVLDAAADDVALGGDLGVRLPHERGGPVARLVVPDAAAEAGPGRVRGEALVEERVGRLGERRVVQDRGRERGVLVDGRAPALGLPRAVGNDLGHGGKRSE